MPTVTLADDNYHSLAQLFGFLGARWEMYDGWVYAVTNGLTFRYGDETAPGATDPGGPIPASGGITVDNAAEGNGYRLDLLWVRNTTAGSNAVVVANWQLRRLRIPAVA